MDSAGSVVLVNLLFSFLDLASRLGDRSTDGLLLKMMYGEKTRDAMTATRVSAGRRQRGLQRASQW
jgi:hypothetical protein